MHCSPSGTPSTTCKTAFRLATCKVESVSTMVSSLIGEYVPFSQPAYIRKT